MQTPPRRSPSPKSKQSPKRQPPSVRQKKANPEISRLLRKYKEIKKSLETEQLTNPNEVKRLFEGALYSLAYKSVTAWDMETTLLIEGTRRSSTLTLYLDLDINTDNLIIKGVQLHFAESDVEGEHSGIFRYGPDTLLDIQPTDERFVSFVGGGEPVSFTPHLVDNVEYSIPNFPQLLGAIGQPKFQTEFKKRVLDRYLVRNGVPTIYSTTSNASTTNTQPLIPNDMISDRFFDLWLSLHDPTLLERMYGLVQTIRTPSLPRLLVTEDDFLKALAIDETTVRRYSTREDSKYSLKNLSVTTLYLQAEDIRYATTAQSFLEDGIEHIRSILNDYITYGDQWQYFVDITYPSRQEAAAALYRLRHLSSIPIEASIQAIPGAIPGAIIGTYRQEGMKGKPKIPASYTKTQAEERWREICLNDTHKRRTKIETNTPIEDLQAIAQALDISLTTLAKVKTDKSSLCSLIQQQYELEFGERSRLTEFQKTGRQPTLQSPEREVSPKRKSKTSPKRR